MPRRSFCFLVLLSLGATSFAVPLYRTADPCISPDAKEIAFAWQGDIWVVPTTGGTATRLTVHPAEDSMPKWSPDGKEIYFCSTRNGSLDMFKMNRDGDNLKRVTFEAGSEYITSLSPDGAYVYGYTTNFGRLDAFRVKSGGGDVVRISSHPLEMEYYPTVSPDGQRVVYNSKGGAGNWRKPGQSGSSTSRIWIAPVGVPLKDSRLVFPGDRNDLFPCFLDNDTLAFVSNRENGPNIWTGKVNGGGLKQLTRFTSGTVRALTVSRDGKTMAFQKDSRVWTLDMTTQSAKVVDINAPADTPRDPNQDFSLTTGASDFVVSPNGKRAVVELRGDLFLVPERGGTTRRLTTSPRLDGQPVWLDDKTILYVAAGDGSLRSLKTVTIDGEVKDWKKDDKDLNTPTLSPDRKWVAYHRADREIWVASTTGTDAHRVATGDFGNSLTGNRAFNWSPDSQWIAYTSTRLRGVVVSMVKPDGTGAMEITRVGKSASTPVFSPDGKAIAFVGVEGTNYSETRDGQSPLYVVDLVPQTPTYSEDDLDKIDTPKDPPTKDVTVRVVERGLKNRVRVLSAAGDVTGLWAGSEGRTVYANAAGQFSAVDLKSGSARPLTGVTGPVSSVSLGNGGQKLYFVQAGKPNAVTLQTGAVAPIAFNAQYTVNLVDEESSLFEEIWWAMDRLYYNEKLNDKDWAGIRKSFAEIVPHVQSREDFYALMGEMMELLDSSHLGANAPGGARSAGGDDVAWLGVEWDWQALDARGSYIVGKVFENTPAALPDSELKVGDRVVAVDGNRLGGSLPLASLLNRKAGRKVVLSVERDSKTVPVTIQPARSAIKTSVFYDDWVDHNKKLVDELSGGRLGYIHIQGMDVPSLDTFLKEIYTDLDGKDGVLLDVRYNGGGFTAHIILNTLLKRPWLIRTNRDDPDHKFSENSYRGNALELPAGCLTNGYSFSNAEIFSEGFRYLKLGPVIGEPTAGGVIGTGAYGLWDGGSIRMPGSGAYAVNGDNLEANGRKPDIEVTWTPNDSVSGRDPQLEAAVKELLKRVKK